MNYVVAFLGGMVAAAAGILIWHFQLVRTLRNQRSELAVWHARLSAYEATLDEQRRRLEAAESQHISYAHLVAENNALKHDLFTLSVQARKSERDHAAIVQQQEAISARSYALAQRYLEDNVAWIGEKITSRNFASCKSRLTRIINECREIGFSVSVAREAELVELLKKKFEEAVREEYHREEQARIRARLREDQRIQRERERLLQEAERERAAADAALKQAERENRHAGEIASLQARLREAEEKARERAKSLAEQTKKGYVYVISNVGSFGKDVYKIGMSRREDPVVRIRELGDASVPFPFDVHAMVYSDDAPALEHALHRELARYRMNRVNFHKEFFRVRDLATIKSALDRHYSGEYEFIWEPPAVEYHESEVTNDEDYEYLERTVAAVEEQEGGEPFDE